MIRYEQKLFIGDSRFLKGVKNNSVDLVVGGPPYFNHIVYSRDKGQLSKISNYHQFLRELEKVWKSCKRVLKPGKRVVIWMHDIYQYDKQGYPIKLISFHTDIVRTLGKYFTIKDIIIWNRYLNRNKGPIKSNLKTDGQVGGRFQYIIVAQRGNKSNFIDADLENYWLPIWQEKTQPKVLGSKFLYRIIFTLAGNRIFKEILEPFKNKLLNDEYLFGNYPTACPKDLVEWAIKKYSKLDEIVLDPFVGSGTTFEVLLRNGRKGIGFDVNKKVEYIIKRKLGKWVRINSLGLDKKRDI